MERKKKNNIAFIGMAGVGKSYFSDKLTSYGYKHIEDDKIITELAHKIGVDKEIIPDNEFIQLEERAIFSLKNTTNSAIDTGGSVIYSEKAMELLRTISTIVYLKDNVKNIKQRFDDKGEAHLIGIKSKTFEELLVARTKLYQKYADIVIDVTKITNVEDILLRIKELDKV